MTIVRADKRENRYTQICTQGLHDTRLSWKARGILAYLLTKPDQWEVRVNHLECQSDRDGRDSVRAGLKELEALGYLQREFLQDPETGRITDRRSRLVECPTVGISDRRESPTEDKPDGRKTRKKENPTDGFPNPIYITDFKLGSTESITDSSEKTRAHEDSASPSEPSEPAIATPPVEKQVPANSSLVEAKQIAEGHFSAAAPQSNFSKTEKTRDHFAERCRPDFRPGHKYPQLFEVGLSHIWIGPSLLDFVPELVEACCRHLKKHNLPHEYGDGQQYLSNRIEKQQWAPIELRQKEMQRHLEQQSFNRVTVAVPSSTPLPVHAESANSNPFGVPTSTDEEADRIRGMARAAKAAGRSLSPAILKRAQELGVELGNVAIAPAPVVSQIWELPPIPPQSVQVAQPAIALEPAKLQSFAELQSVFSGLGLSMSVVDASELLAEIQVVQQCLGWSQAELDLFVEAEFNVRSTHHLEDEELERLLKLLKTQQLAGGVA